jgi:hypothetical protein
VLVEVKKVMTISSMVISTVVWEEYDMEEVGLTIEAMVFVEEADPDVVMPDIVMLSMAIRYGEWEGWCRELVVPKIVEYFVFVLVETLPRASCYEGSERNMRASPTRNAGSRSWWKTVAPYASRSQPRLVGDLDSIVSYALPVLALCTPSQATHALSALAPQRTQTNILGSPSTSVISVASPPGCTSTLSSSLVSQCLSLLMVPTYGGIRLQKYYECDQVLIIIAGGTGAGWCLPFIELFARPQRMRTDEECGRGLPTDDKEGRRQGNRCDPLSLQVILAVRDSSSRAWFLRSVNEPLAEFLINRVIIEHPYLGVSHRGSR